MKYLTKNFDIEYEIQKYKVKTTLVTEIFRRHIFKEMINTFSGYCDDYKILCVKTDEDCEGATCENKPNACIRNMVMRREIMVYLIYKMDHSDDPMFTPNPELSDQDLQDIIKKDNVLEFKKNDVKQLAKKTKKLISDAYKKLKSLAYDDTQIFRIDKKHNEHNIIELKLVLLPNAKLSTELKKMITDDKESDNLLHTYKVSFFNYKHMKRLFIHQVYDLYYKDTPDFDEVAFHRALYMLLYRYHTLQGGGTQASIMPDLKRYLKQSLNVRVELFGSAINTSNIRYGSIFDDVEETFGSLGSFFNMNIRSGYYELNPPFDVTTVRNMFEKLSMWLQIAERNQKPLLFIVFIPTKERKIEKCKGFKELKKNEYLRNTIFVQKKDFPYIYTNLTFTKVKIKPIINTTIYIFHTSAIKPWITKSVNDFKEIYYNWLAVWMKTTRGLNYKKLLEDAKK